MSGRVVCLLALSAALAWAQTKPRVVVIAHRGEHLKHPENTMEAFQGALAAGADFFELDVRTTQDGKLVLMHDGSVNRMTNGSGNVAAMTFDAVRRLEVGGMQTKVPTFDEALAFARGKIGIYVDSKSISAADAIAAIQAHDMQDHVVIYGGLEYLKEIAKTKPAMKVMPEAGSPDQLRSLLAELPLRVVGFDAKDFNDQTIAVAQAAKLDIYVDRLGLADNPVAWQDAIDRGATGIQTDHPAELVGYLKFKGYR